VTAVPDRRGLEVHVAETDYQVEFDGCGEMTYQGP